MVVLYPRACNNFAKEAAIIPFPKEEVTPPVTKMYLVGFIVFFLEQLITSCPNYCCVVM